MTESILSFKKAQNYLTTSEQVETTFEEVDASLSKSTIKSLHYSKYTGLTVSRTTGHVQEQKG